MIDKGVCITTTALLITCILTFFRNCLATEGIPFHNKAYEWPDALCIFFFLDALSSSRSLVVGPSVGRSFCPSVGRSGMFVQKWPLEYQKVIKTYSSDSSDSSDTSDRSDSSDSSDSNDSSDSCDQTTLYTKKLNLPKPTYLRDSSYCSDNSDSSDQKNFFTPKKRFHQNFFFFTKKLFYTKNHATSSDKDRATSSHTKNHAISQQQQKITQPLHKKNHLWCVVNYNFVTKIRSQKLCDLSFVTTILWLQFCD